MSKRILDLVLATIGLLVLWPIFVIIAIAIKLDSTGPIFFRQERVGRNGKIFRIHKFRTMRLDRARDTLQLTVGKDPRITHSGHFLRKYKLDELAQLLDVVSGDMSLVGPRPEVPRYVELYPEELKTIILSIRPGITDNAALEFFDESAVLADADDPERAYVDFVLPKKLAMYKAYVQKRTFLGDIRIIARTIARIFA